MKDAKEAKDIEGKLYVKKVVSLQHLEWVKKEGIKKSHDEKFILEMRSMPHPKDPTYLGYMQTFLSDIFYDIMHQIDYWELKGPGNYIVQFKIDNLLNAKFTVYASEIQQRIYVVELLDLNCGKQIERFIDSIIMSFYKTNFITFNNFALMPSLLVEHLEEMLNKPKVYPRLKDFKSSNSSPTYRTMAIPEGTYCNSFLTASEDEGFSLDRVLDMGRPVVEYESTDFENRMDELESYLTKVLKYIEPKLSNDKTSLLFDVVSYNRNFYCTSEEVIRSSVGKVVEELEEKRYDITSKREHIKIQNSPHLSVGMFLCSLKELFISLEIIVDHKHKLGWILCHGLYQHRAISNVIGSIDITKPTNLRIDFLKFLGSVNSLY